MPENFRLKDYLAVGAHTIYCQEVANPRIYKPHDVPREFDVTWHFTTYKNYKTSPAQRRKFHRYRSELQSALIAEISDEHRKKEIDLFFSYFWSEICSPETIDRIRSLGIRTVNWYCNGSYQFDLVAELAPRFDWCLVPEKFRLKDYLAAGARPIYCQEAANPKREERARCLAPAEGYRTWPWWTFAT